MSSDQGVGPPVSYTHLDVYKRQGQEYVDFDATSLKKNAIQTTVQTAVARAREIQEASAKKAASTQPSTPLPVSAVDAAPNDTPLDVTQVQPAPVLDVSVSDERRAS